ncbi:hypothetical protein GOODEAATRI_031234, partial [Goodea atripinnis]
RESVIQVIQAQHLTEENQRELICLHMVRKTFLSPKNDHTTFGRRRNPGLSVRGRQAAVC